jgi:chaperone BCS1
MPKNSILLIEDIDCAFPSREDADDEEPTMNNGYPGVMGPPFTRIGRKSAVTLSGLLNVIDGVGSEEGKLFFATVSTFCFTHALVILCVFVDKLYRPLGSSPATPR